MKLTKEQAAYLIERIKGPIKTDKDYLICYTDDDIAYLNWEKIEHIIHACTEDNTDNSSCKEV